MWLSALLPRTRLAIDATIRRPVLRLRNNSVDRRGGRSAPTTVWLVDEPACEMWTRFVTEHPQGGLFHTLAWRDALAEAGHGQPYYLMAVRGDEAVGVLPLFETVSGDGERQFDSLPATPGGGVLARDAESAELLLERARTFAAGRGVRTMKQNTASHDPCCEAPCQTRFDPQNDIDWRRLSFDRALARVAPYTNGMARNAVTVSLPRHRRAHAAVIDRDSENRDAPTRRLTPDAATLAALSATGCPLYCTRLTLQRGAVHAVWTVHAGELALLHTGPDGLSLRTHMKLMAAVARAAARYSPQRAILPLVAYGDEAAPDEIRPKNLQPAAVA